MTHRLSRIAPLALTIAAVAAPAAQAVPADGPAATSRAVPHARQPVTIDPISPDARDADQPVSIDRRSPDARDAGGRALAVPVTIDPISPDARDAGQPVSIDRRSPDARDAGSREPIPVIVPAPPVVHADGFDWTDAGLGAAALAALLALAAGTAVLTRRHAVRAS